MVSFQMRLNLSDNHRWHPGHTFKILERRYLNRALNGILIFLPGARRTLEEAASEPAWLGDRPKQGENLHFVRAAGLVSLATSAQQLRCPLRKEVSLDTGESNLPLKK